MENTKKEEEKRKLFPGWEDVTDDMQKSFFLGFCLWYLGVRLDLYFIKKNRGCGSFFDKTAEEKKTSWCHMPKNVPKPTTLKTPQIILKPPWKPTEYFFLNQKLQL